MNAPPVERIFVLGQERFVGTSRPHPEVHGERWVWASSTLKTAVEVEYPQIPQISQMGPAKVEGLFPSSLTGADTSAGKRFVICEICEICGGNCSL